MAKKLLSALLSVVLVVTSLVFANAAVIDDVSTSAVTTPSSAASQAIDDKYGYDGNDLGATYTNESTTFKVWAPTATEVVLNLYATGSDEEVGATDLGNYNLEKVFEEDAFTGVWSCTIHGDLLNIYYTYTITSYKVTDFDIENEVPIKGAVPRVTETQDVYSIATGVNSARSMVCDLDITDPDGWENDQHVLLDKSTQSTVWEVHIKDFSFSETSGVSKANRGKYLGFTERGTTLNGEGNIATCIDYLKEFGVTTVQILPFYDYGSVDEAGDLDKQFNWGYDPMNYNVPEGSYSSNPYDGNVRIKECKQMIQALHSAGISVVMDVVYNHTYSYDSCFEAVVPNYYYRMKANGEYSNGSGCGNETASEREMFRKYIIQSVLHWVNEYHVDGFRFDLMGILDVETMNLIREELDKVDERITMWGEGWTGGGCTYPETTCTGEKLYGAVQGNAKLLDENVAFFNDGIRDSVRGKALNTYDRGWVQGSSSLRAGVRQGMVANTHGGKWNAKSPAQCVTYVSCHDNTTLWDKLCDSNGYSTDYSTRYNLVVEENKLAAAITMLSQGVNFIQAGEEMGRTKHGDHNSYSSSPEINMIDWSLLVSNADILSYYKGLLKIRNNFDIITDDTIESSDKFTPKQINAKNTVTYFADNDTEGQWDKMVLLYNNGEEDIEFEVSDPNLTDDMEWVIIANDETAGFKNLGEVKGNTFVIPARGALIAVDKVSFEAVNIPNDTGKVVVEHIDTVKNEVLDRFVVADNLGNYFKTDISKAVSNIYKLTDIEGQTSGIFTEEDQYIKYYYDYYVPESLDIDPNNDGNLNINDVTYMQRALANMIELPNDVTSSYDCNYDDDFSINDVTMIQKHLAGMSVSVGEVQINFYKTDENGNPTEEVLSRSKMYSSRIGTEFTAEPTKALGYRLNENLLPEIETVTVGYGVIKEINYYYDYIGSDVDIYVKHNGNLTWDPTIWIWGQQFGVDSGINYCKNRSWPGDTLSHIKYTGLLENLTENKYTSCGCIPSLMSEGEESETDTETVEVATSTGALGVGTYILNTTEKVIHSSTCESGANIITEEKCIHTGSVDQLIEDGYTACEDCMSAMSTYIVSTGTGKIHTENCHELDWYSTSFEGDSSDHTYSVIISNDGGGQSIDCKGFAENKLWIVIDDANSISSTSLLFYDVNPDENPEAKPIFEAYK